MPVEFTNLDAAGQRLQLYNKILAVETQLLKQNGSVARNTEMINKNCKGLLVIKVLGIVIFTIGCVLAGFGVPNIPIF